LNQRREVATQGGCGQDETVKEEKVAKLEFYALRKQDGGDGPSPFKKKADTIKNWTMRRVVSPNTN